MVKKKRDLRCLGDCVQLMSAFLLLLCFLPPTEMFCAPTYVSTCRSKYFVEVDVKMHTIPRSMSISLSKTVSAPSS